MGGARRDMDCNRTQIVLIELLRMILSENQGNQLHQFNQRSILSQVLHVLLELALVDLLTLVRQNFVHFGLVSRIRRMSSASSGDAPYASFFFPFFSVNRYM